nr:hypothetical protein Iba_chr09bCG14450 [Ipomoea batatas]
MILILKIHSCTSYASKRPWKTLGILFCYLLPRTVMFHIILLGLRCAKHL